MAKRKSAEPVHGAAALFLRIVNSKGKATLYRLVSLNTDPHVANPAWRLWKEYEGEGEHYDVRLGPHGPECDCPDFLVRRVNEAEKCKHCKAIEAVGLLRPLRVSRKAEA